MSANRNLKNVIIKAPNGANHFGYVEEVITKRYTIPQGPIVLRYGFHKVRRGKASGFGREHIWEGHKHDLIKWGYPTINDVPRYCASILIHGRPVYPNPKTPDFSRLIAIRTYHGHVVIEYREEENFWSIVTAFNTKTPRGAQVTRIIASPETS